MPGERSFIVGETVRVTAKVSHPDTRAPIDANVVEVALFKRDGNTVALNPSAFTRVGEGDYELLINTTGFTPGNYRIITRVNSGATAVVLVEDQFVLVPLA